MLEHRLYQKTPSKATPVPVSHLKPIRNKGELRPGYFRDSRGPGSSNRGCELCNYAPTPTSKSGTSPLQKRSLIPEALPSCHSGSLYGEPFQLSNCHLKITSAPSLAIFITAFRLTSLWGPSRLRRCTVRKRRQREQPGHQSYGYTVTHTCAHSIRGHTITRAQSRPSRSRTIAHTVRRHALAASHPLTPTSETRCPALPPPQRPSAWNSHAAQPRSHSPAASPRQTPPRTRVTATGTGPGCATRTHTHAQVRHSHGDRPVPSPTDAPTHISSRDTARPPGPDRHTDTYRHPHTRSHFSPQPQAEAPLRASSPGASLSPPSRAASRASPVPGC